MSADNDEEGSGHENDVLTRVLARGPDWTGREYTRQLRRSLAADDGPHADAWVSNVIFEAGDDEDLLWCIADGPVDHVVDRDLKRLGARFHRERIVPGVDLMFSVMQRYLRHFGGPDLGSWDDNFFGLRGAPEPVRKRARRRVRRASR